MNAMVCEIPRVLRAERLKMKGTLAFWLALIAPAVIVSLQVLSAYMNRDLYYTVLDLRGSGSLRTRFPEGVRCYPWVVLMLNGAMVPEYALISDVPLVLH